MFGKLEVGGAIAGVVLSVTTEANIIVSGDLFGLKVGVITCKLIVKNL